METIEDIARRIIKEERDAYCVDELGWDREKVVLMMAPPATWIQRAVERALRECPVCSRSNQLGEALNDQAEELIRISEEEL